MTTPRDPDAILSAWLEEGPDQLPDATRRAIAVSTRTTRQTRHAMRVPWRINPMSSLARLALAAAVIVAVMGGALYLVPVRRLEPAADRVRSTWSLKMDDAGQGSIWMDSTIALSSAWR